MKDRLTRNMRRLAALVVCLAVLLGGCGRTPVVEIPGLSPRAEDEILAAQLGDLDGVLTAAQRSAALELLRQILPLREARVVRDDPEPGAQETELLEELNLLLSRYTQHFLGTTTDWEAPGASREVLLAQFAVDEDGKLAPHGRGHHKPGDGLSVPENWQPVWDKARSILPDDAWRPFTEFILWTDGPSGTLAYVERLDSAGDEWVLAVDPADLEDDGLFAESVIHEYMHYLTLNSSQVEYRIENTLRVYTEPDLVANTDSYINQFYQRFWTMILDDRMLDTLDGLFYLRHESEFVSEYAAVHPSEDICESFASFVLEDEAPAGETLAEQKLLFFYEYPELTALRDDIRSRLGSAAQAG